MGASAPAREGPAVPGPTIVDLPVERREEGVPVVIAGFVGIYRWHAKRTLRRIESVRAASMGGGWVGLAMLERLEPEVGYVYYIAVRPEWRGRGIGGRLLDDALARFRAAGATVAYAAVEEENRASERLFGSRGFRPVDRKERGYRAGGLGAWGLYRRMMVVSGERLLGRRLEAEGPGAAP